jgi:hypothetical protein
MAWSVVYRFCCWWQAPELFFSPPRSLAEGFADLLCWIREYSLVPAIARMRFLASSTLVLLPAFWLSTQGVRIIQSNDDGWAELYVRSLNDALNAAGHQVVLSAPAENKSGTSTSCLNRSHDVFLQAPRPGPGTFAHPCLGS